MAWLITGRYDAHDRATLPLVPPVIRGGSVFTAAFWRDLAERVVRTTAQSAISLIPSVAVGWLAFDWRGAALTVGTAALACVLMALIAAPVGDQGTASFLPQPHLNRHERES